MNVYLIGLMGAGKTTIGRSLAKRLGLSFIDTDKEIEARTGVSIPTIFEIEGEEGFRKRETQVLREAAEKSACIVATGGGAAVREENRRIMRESGYVVYLDASPQMLWERTRHDKNRPLLQVADPLAKLTQLSAVRDPLYREIADLVIDSTRLSAQGLLQTLLKELAARLGDALTTENTEKNQNL
jgi:shikimate kinase